MIPEQQAVLDAAIALAQRVEWRQKFRSKNTTHIAKPEVEAVCRAVAALHAREQQMLKCPDPPTHPFAGFIPEEWESYRISTRADGPLST